MDEDFRYSSYNILLQAKKKTHSKIAYFNFVNAYHLYHDGDDSFGNVCCMSIDKAKDLLKKKRKQVFTLRVIKKRLVKSFQSFRD